MCNTCLNCLPVLFTALKGVLAVTLASKVGRHCMRVCVVKNVLNRGTRTWCIIKHGVAESQKMLQRSNGSF